MKLSTRGEYALRALLVLGQDYLEDDSVVRIQEISAQQNIPKRFLEQILNDLKSARIVESKRGVAGGYRLSRPPGKNHAGGNHPPHRRRAGSGKLRQRTVLREMFLPGRSTLRNSFRHEGSPGCRGENR